MLRPTCLLAVLLLALGLVACKRLAPAPGPVELRGTEHMTSYLASAPAWRLGDRDTDRAFSFAPEGTFSASGSGLGAVLGLPADPGPIVGRWSADTSRLQLTWADDSAESGWSSADLPLRWVDGKLRIEIAGERYRRSQ